MQKKTQSALSSYCAKTGVNRWRQCDNKRYALSCASRYMKESEKLDGLAALAM